MNQRERLRNYLDTGQVITRFKAYSELGIASLAAVVHDVEKIDKYPIHRRLVPEVNQFDEVNHVMEYFKPAKKEPREWTGK